MINNMDTRIIAFVRNKLTKAIYPLKINEYLAMGSRWSALILPTSRTSKH